MAKDKSFDCVEMKHRAAVKIHNELKGKSIKERLDFWRNQKKAMSRRLSKSNAV